jgi:hypothetical protein
MAEEPKSMNDSGSTQAQPVNQDVRPAAQQTAADPRAMAVPAVEKFSEGAGKKRS